MKRKGNLNQANNQRSGCLKVNYWLPAVWLSCLFFWPLLPAAGQTDSLSRMAKQLQQYQEQHLPEKVFVHLDRPAYVAGETMWFKIYAVDGTTNKPLQLSKVAYVEVIGPNQQAVMQAKIVLQAGSGHGSLGVPLTLNSGTYAFRAYTAWMQNQSPEFYFQQPITIVNTTQPLALKPIKDAPIYQVQFFPEGGYLVQGLTSQVAFKITDNTGKGVWLTGEVKDPAGNTVATLQPLKFGMGTFSFTPAAHTTYTAVIRLPNGRSLTQNLPPVQAQGYVMHLPDDDSQAENLNITVQASLNAANPTETLYLLAHTRGANAVARAATLAASQLSFTLPKSALGAGLTHLTVFNSRRQPVCERLYFKPVAQQQLTIRAQTNETAYSTRQKVTLDVTTQSAAGATAPADLSLAVYRLDSLQNWAAAHIQNYLWLTSDLTGPIENPAFYFTENNPEARTALNNLLLTQGWRRFRWPEVWAQNQPAPAFIPEINGPIIRGQVTNRLTGTPAPNITTYLAAPSKHIRLYNAISNPAGRIQFEVKDFYGPKEIVVQSNFTQDSLYHFQIFSPFSAQFTAQPLPPLPITERRRPEIALRHLQMQVQEAYHHKYQPQVQLPVVDSLPFYGPPDEQYFLDNFTRFKVMEEVMREYVPGVMVRIRKDGFHFLTIDHQNRGVFQRNPMVLLDGVPVFDINKIMAFDPLKIQRLDVVTSRYFRGSQVFDGVVSYTTYRGDLGGFPVDARALLQEYEGLQIPRDFYAPVYDTPQQQQSRLPDLRNLLYWAPAIKTGAQGQQQVQFYTSDQDGAYVVVIQGLSPSGEAGSVTVPIMVKRAL